jgi:hypothetical protein
MTGTTPQICVQACLFFNVALEKAIRDSGIQIGWHIFQKSVQLLAYADDIVLLGRTRSRLEEAFIDPERVAGRIWLKINYDKTKYMVICARMQEPSELIIDWYKFEQVVGFTYLGTKINKENNLIKEVVMSSSSNSLRQMSLLHQSDLCCLLVARSRSLLC